MVHVTCREQSSGRWVELTLTRTEGETDQHLLAYVSGFACRIEAADEVETPHRFEDWEQGILAGAMAAFEKLKIAPSRLQLNRVCGRLGVKDMPALAHAASIAVLALFGKSKPDSDLCGWTCDARVTPPAKVRADAAHALKTTATPHIAPLEKGLPGNQFIPRLGRFSFKRADTPEEIEQVHRLNYRTFVKEIQQHADNGQGRLVDKFHDWNTYFLAILDDRVIGMLSVHDRAPFSVESRLPNPAMIREPGMRPLEVRLLAIEHAERHGPVLVGLTYVMNYFARENGYTHYLISAVTEQLTLYKHLGFAPLGPAMGKPGAMFVPMIATLEQVDEQMRRTMVLWEKRAAREAAAAGKNPTP